MTILLSGCSEKILYAKGKLEHSEVLPDTNKNDSKPTDQKQNNVEHTGQPGVKSPDENSKPQEQEASTPPADTPSAKNNNDSIQVVFNPESIPVLVNKQNKLPDSYNPNDLVYTDIPFISGTSDEKRKMRQEAATAINQLFVGAKAQGISLLGVSAYRSHATQTTLFNYYVNRDGYEKARTYSALPGTSEHETGLSIDVTGGDGKCAAENCFGGTPEAIWLEQHAEEYGFIIRYPQGKESITGYQYEPWHLRYVGKEIALEIMNKGISLEEYHNEEPVSN
ncbi:M15 family metallopeptidase [Neobacillus niacini]|uniref:M15 family metallopeptidase n=1 Tax=Neobacillus niacini TaxID=86668 RepID=UPI001EE6DB2A|nr:M15 family metallopeptidase [Neobacillus niacini]